jgi:acyl-coenzyme A synthetase/AMP-(fatty) acid ligase
VPALFELLSGAAAEVPRQSVVLTPETALSYADCLARAERVATGLSARSIDRFAARVDDVADLVALLCASSLCGSEACVYPAALRAAEVDELAAQFEHHAVITDDVVEELAAVDAPPAAPAAAEPVLILTTGTTGSLKGVRHDWRRMVAAVRHRDARPGARWLLAYNLNQFAGIQILLHVLASRATLVSGSTRDPRDAIAAMRDLGVTHVSATPTFWRLVLARLDPDAARALPIEQVTLGGEAVPSPLLEGLKERFPRARISQIYGATEFGTGVSVRDGRPGLPLSVLERPDDADVRFRIVDGELYVRSRVGMRGYHGADDEGGGWRPTGDLVEVRGDRIHFVGRASEIINVGGVKVHPLPVEHVVTRVPGVEAARAYGRANPVAGQIVALDVVARDDVDTDELAGAIRAACEELPPAARPRRIRFVDELEVRQNKLARNPAAAER